MQSKSPADTVTDGRISDVFETPGGYGRALVAANDDSGLVVGFILWCDGSVMPGYLDCGPLAEELMGVPESRGLWVWEGVTRLAYNEEGIPYVHWKGGWRRATAREVLQFAKGNAPFEAWSGFA